MVDPLSNLPIAKLSLKEIKRRQDLVAMQTPEHLEKWLLASKRRFLIYDAKDLNDSLKALWPHGHKNFQDLTHIYLMHRMLLPNGEV